MAAAAPRPGAAGPGRLWPEGIESETATSEVPEVSVAANPLTLADYPIRASADQRSLVTATGKPFTYIADTPWGLASKLSQADVIAYLEDREAKGFNTIQMMLLPMPSEWGTKNTYGDSPFNNMNPASPAITPVATTNPADASGYDYWDHVEWVIDQAGARGIQVAAAVSWYGYGGRDWRPYMTTSAATAYGTFLGQRFGGKPHLFWILLLRPDHRSGNTVKLLSSGYGTTSTNGGLDYGVSAIASDNSFGLAYFPTTRSDIVVNLAALGGGSVRLSWWNPGVGGAKTLIGTYAGTGTRALTWPSGYTDALLVAERASTTTPGTLLRAINLGGPALTIDGRSWEGSTGAPNLTTSGTRFEDQTIPLVPATDAARAQMIRSCIYSTTAAVNLGAVPSGAYDVYLYVWEDNATKTFDVRAEGVLVQDDYVSGNPGQWKRLGPWVVSVTDGTLNVVTSGGTANLSGIEVYHR